MSSKTRKLIWSVPLVATLAIVGALAAFVALGLPNADPVQAQDGGFTTNPPALEGLSISTGNGILDVTWDEPTSANRGIPTYNAISVQYVRVDASGSPMPDPDSSAWTDAPGTGALGRGDVSHRITGLTNGNYYFARVALALQGEGDPGDDTYAVFDSNGVSSGNPAISPIAGVPGKPTGVTITQTSDRSTDDPPTATAIVSWTAPENDGGSPIIGYVVEVDRDGEDPFTADNTATTSLTRTSLHLVRLLPVSA